MTSPASSLPAQRIDAAGRIHVDVRAMLALALPLMVNSAVQLVLSLTDVWFIGHISTSALAAVSSVHWMAMAVVMALSGIGMAVQTVAAQAFGARCYTRASQAVWIAMWGVLIATPLFVLIGLAGNLLVGLFGLPPDIHRQAADFWLPRVAGSPFGAAAWAVFGFFNGVSRPRLTLLVTAVMAIANALLNWLFIFHFNWGVTGSGLATSAAQAIGLMLALLFFLDDEFRTRFRSHLTWTPHWRRVLQQFQLGLPMGLLVAADLIGFSIFQVMQVKLDAVAGAATQLVMVLTAFSYMPGVGMAMAGTTLVGQSIGAGDRNWAYKLGTRSITLASCYMGGMGVLLALTGPWLLPWFTSGSDPQTPAVIALGEQLLWFAAVYQFFDGLNLGSSFCLRGAGDARVPAMLVLALSWIFFVPLSHVLTFAPGEGWFTSWPALGYGALGGWSAVIAYIFVAGTLLTLRWRSRAWQRLRHL
ncbi:MAG: MATE family efflux transporter [Steroidobacteraceae bacterium]